MTLLSDILSISPIGQKTLFKEDCYDFRHFQG